jgi:hypothetical protein
VCRGIELKIKRPLSLIDVVVVLPCLYCGCLQAAVIVGPDLTLDERLQFSHGIAFTALDDAIITGFVYQNQGLSDEVTLSMQSTPAVILDSIVVPFGEDSFGAAVSWSISFGESYVLLGNNAFNGKFAEGADLFPESDADISVNSGDFSNELDPDDWGDFDAIDTISLPEPTFFGASIAVFTFYYEWGKRRSRRGKKSLTAYS